MALAPSTSDLPIAAAPPAPLRRRRQQQLWRLGALDIARRTAERFPFAVIAWTVVVLITIGATVPRAGAALLVAAVLAFTCTAAWKATRR